MAMQIIRHKAGDVVVRRQDKVMEWYLIQEGSVVRKFAFAESLMGRNAIIGIMESEWFSCDYVAKEDCALIAIPCKDAVDLRNILSAHENFRPIFLKTAVEQRHQLLAMYDSLRRKVLFLHETAQSMYNDYKNLCSTMLLEEQPFPRMDQYEALIMQHRAEEWEMASSKSLVTNYLREFMQLMVKDDALCVAAIMEASMQMRRVTLGISEMVRYLLANRDLLCSDTDDDIFHLYLNVAVQLSAKKLDKDIARMRMKNVIEAMGQLRIYSEHQMQECENIYDNFDYSEVKTDRINVVKTDCVATILNYAGYDKQKIREFKERIAAYRNLPDKLSTENEVRTLRKQISAVFYETYQRAFLRSMLESQKLSPILSMFFNFGFMDVQLLGEDLTNAIYSLTDSLDFFGSDHIFTIYEWLKQIYEGKAEPSKNEFDQDYISYLNEQRRSGDINDEQLAAYKKDRERKVEFEIKNLFRNGHRITYGQITTFCPVLAEHDMLTTVEKMAVTAEKIEAAINRVRKLDYSVLFREVLFSDPAHGINQEWIMKEVMPNVILMPCAGSKSMMWQEVAGPKSDTPARFIFPIFATTDLDEQMLETMGRYRWEICRRIQGVYWNDIRERSLTAEYYDYIQFYKKNSDLSADAKEKIKTALVRSRNNFREVFVRDYVNWMKYESQGSFRLNKVARDILSRYCPFGVDVRQSLASNPQYQTAFAKLDATHKKNAQRLSALYDKYEAAGGTITADLKENLRYYLM